MSIIRPTNSLILIAEDNPDHAELIRETILDYDRNIVVQHKMNGEETMDYLQHLHAQSLQLPNVILMDIKMPRMNGIETVAAIKYCPELRDIPIIMLSTSTNEAEMRICIRSGALSYISKPLETTDFEEKILPLLTSTGPTHPLPSH